MILWVTDNELSHTVMNAIGGEIKHIRDFDSTPLQPSVFYGLLRGNSRAMHILKYHGIDYWYIDNGYFDAKYVDKKMHKSMDGMFRVVKNDTHDVYPGSPIVSSGKIESVLVLPPSPYSASFHHTTPEDWTASVMGWMIDTGHPIKATVRHKGSNTPFSTELKDYDAVVAFNSMAVMEAIAAYKPAFDTHGILRNLERYPNPSIYSPTDIRKYYETKQCSLEYLRGIAWE